MTTPYQGDLLLDLVEAARNVRDLFSIKEDAEQGHNDQDVKDWTGKYDAAVEKFAEVYAEADLYVADSMLERICQEFLPQHLQLAIVERGGVA